MTRIVRLSMVNWYLYASQDIEMRGATAILGPNGVGKSSLLDAIQLVMTGNNRRYLKLNASSNVTSGSVRRNRDDTPRSVLGYCLGTVDRQRMRENSVTHVCVTFEADDGTRLSAGISLVARAGDPEEETSGAFILPGGDLSAQDFLVSDGEGGLMPIGYDAFVNAMRARALPIEDYRSRLGGAFTKTLLNHLAGKRSVDSERFLRAARNALQLREITSANDFVRDFVLEADPLDIQALRDSVSRYRGFQEKISDLEIQERELREISDQHRKLGDAALKAAGYDWMLARFRRDRAADRRTALRANLQKLATERHEHETKATVIREGLDDLRRRMIRAEEARRHDGVGRAIATLEDEASAKEGTVASTVVERDGLMAAARHIGEAAAGLRGLFPALEMDPTAIRGARLVRAFQSEDSSQIDTLIADLLPHVDTALLAIEEHRITVAGREHVLRAEMTDMQGRLRRMKESGGAIGGATARFLDMLAEDGIDAAPLCDLVEIPDETWRDVAEGVLGLAREAVVVPTEAIPVALAMLRRNRRLLAGCRIVVHRRNASQPVEGGLSSLLFTSDPQARAFIDEQIGHLTLADAVELAERGEDAVMSDGTLSSRGSAEVIEPVSVPMLGREARRLALGRMEGEIADRASRADVYRGEMEKLADAERRLRQGRTMPTGRSLIKLQTDVIRLSEEVASIRQKAKSLELETPDGVADVFAAFEAEQTTASTSLSQAERALYDVRLQLDRTTSDVESADGALTQALADLDKADEALHEHRPDMTALDLEYASMIDDESGHETFETKVQGMQRTAAATSARLGGAAPQMTKDFAWRNRSEGFDPEAGQADQAAWVAAQLETVAGHGLRRYKEQADEARTTMESALREHLLVKLYARIIEARRQIADLNRQLSVKRFHREIYEIRVEVDAGYREIVEVARRVHEQADDVTDLFANPATYGADVARGVERVRAMIESEGDAGLVGDYRNYLQFDLVTRNEEGRIVSDHGSRSQTGSGGERQVPFYIAIAAALASACYGSPVPGRKSTGLGLALFDEAFNALDDANIAACLQFMSELGLQVVAAAPEGKRPQFMENMDTVVSIYRQGLHCEIDVEHTSAAGRQAFRDANPINPI